MPGLAVACSPLANPFGAVPAQNEMNGASGPSDIEGKAARVAASKPGGARVSISPFPAEDSPLPFTALESVFEH